jgi:hypothetical protein
MTFRERMEIKQMQNADFDMFVAVCLILGFFTIWKG